MRYNSDGVLVDIQDDGEFRIVTEAEMITLFRGVAKTFKAAFKDSDTLDPIDLTGATVHAELAGTSIDSYYGLDGNAILGKVKWDLTADAATGLIVGRAVLTGEILRSGKNPITFSQNVEISDLPV